MMFKLINILLIIFTPLFCYADSLNGGSIGQGGYNIQVKSTTQDVVRPRIIEFTGTYQDRGNGVISVPSGGGSAVSQVSNAAYGISWDNVTNLAPSQNALYDYLSTLSLGAGTPGTPDLSVQYRIDVANFGGFGKYFASGDQVEVNRLKGDILLNRLGNPTYTTLQHWFNAQSAGRVSGGVLAAKDTTHITVTAGTGIIKTSNSALGNMVFIDFPANSNLLITANLTNYIYVDYNSGSPVVAATTTRTNINKNSQFVLGACFGDGAENPHVTTTGMNAYNWATDEHSRIVEVNRVQRASGGDVSNTNLDIATTAGVFYVAGIRQTTTAIDTAGAGTFTYIYRNGVGGWTTVASQSELNTSNYDDGDGTLGNIAISKYGVQWVWILYDGTVYVQYGINSYSLTDATLATLPPTLPQELTDFGILAAKIIIQRGASSATSVVSGYTTAFPVSATPVHNDLSGLQGGTTGEYYHFTSAGYTKLNGWLPHTILTPNGGLSLTDAATADRVYVNRIATADDVQTRILRVSQMATSDQVYARFASFDQVDVRRVTSAIHHLTGALTNPEGMYTNEEHNIPLGFVSDNLMTIQGIKVTLDADPTTEIDADLKYCDSYIGFTNAVTICALDTTAGAFTSTAAYTIPKNKLLYIAFNAAPDVATHNMGWDIKWYYN